MRNYIRHSSDVPIRVSRAPVDTDAQPCLKDISYGGLSFYATQQFEPGAIIQFEIPVAQEPIRAQGRVAWCKALADRFEIGIEFLDQQDEFRVRMVEQICHIEHYKKEVYKKHGRLLSGQEAAVEWIDKFAANFP